MESGIKRLLSLAFGCLLGLMIRAQSDPCDGQRFIYPVFDSVSVSKDIVYGRNVTIGGDSIDLLLDIYEPWEDPLSERAVVFLIHGGGFTSGSKDGQRFVKLGTNYARRGYIAVSLNYRLYDLENPPDSFLLKDEVVRAMGDLKAAMRFMIENSTLESNFRVDTSKFFLFGVSAGAIIANTTAYLDDLSEADEQMQTLILQHGGMQGNSSNNTYLIPTIKGVLNSSGGLFDYKWIDADDPPLESIHCMNDPVMPYIYDWLVIRHTNVIKAFGSKPMHDRAEMLGVRNHIISVPGEMHVQYYNDSILYDSLLYTSSVLFQDIICSDSGGFPVALPEQNIAKNVYLYPNPASQYFNVKGLQAGEISIYNGMGILVRKEKLGVNKISVVDMKPGLYHVVISANNILYRQKLLLAR